MGGIKNEIRRTKAYARKYGQNLTDDQLFLRLISDKVRNFGMIKGECEKVKQNGNWERKMEIAKEFVREHLLKIKGVIMVGITGSTATEMVSENEDIDLLIVTKRNELWWWRFYLRLCVLTNKIPHRKFGVRERANEFCFNLWLDENNLMIPKKKQNLKNATDLIMMKVILNRDNCYQRFLGKNIWVTKYLATGYNQRLEKDKTIKEENVFEKGNSIKMLVNIFLYIVQYLYMRTKNKKLMVNLGQAFFHEDN